MTDYTELDRLALNRLIAERRGYHMIREAYTNKLDSYYLVDPAQGRLARACGRYAKDNPDAMDAAWGTALQQQMPNWGGCLDDAWPLLWEIGGLDDALRDDFEELRTPQAAARAISERRCQDWDVEHGGLG